MKKIIHIVTHLGGGVGHVLTNIAMQSELMGQYHHEFLCLDTISPFSEKLIKEKKVVARSNVSYEDIYTECENADIVQIDWWNHPLLNTFLSVARLPPVRLVVYSHVSGFYLPHVFTKEILDYSDIFVVSSPYSCEQEVIQNLSTDLRNKKVKVVFVAGGSTERVEDVRPVKHDGFNVSYIGTVDFCKMHANYVQMSAAAKIPGLKYIVCGGDMQNTLQDQAMSLGKEELFEFRGFVDVIHPVLEISDVFGYPLCQEHYGTGEQALLEAMAAGVVPVVFAHGAEKNIVNNNETGILVKTEEEYTRAIEYLYKNPVERIRMCENARRYAKENFTIIRTIEKFDEVFDEILMVPKHERIFNKCFTANETLDLSMNQLGSRVFLNSIGESGEYFISSIESTDIEDLFSADRKIAACIAGMKAETRGGVIHYSKLFPSDYYLKFWHALIMQHDGDHISAIELFQEALEGGFDHWRIYWYLFLSAKVTDNSSLVLSSLEYVRSKEPAFKAAIEATTYAQLLRH